MNIEDILPELFGEKRIYYCQRCLNHGLREQRKNHKQTCLYRACKCDDCLGCRDNTQGIQCSLVGNIYKLTLVDRRRELNSRLMQIDSPNSDNCATSEGSPMQSQEPETTGKAKERRPNCQRCAQHNVVNRLKGHKRSCPFKDCFCPKCQVVVERQKLMADQIKLRRKQKREKSLLMEASQSPPAPAEPPNWPKPSESLMCFKCAQQAISYQQLMSVLDPTTPTDPMATLAAIIHACPHRQ